MPPRLAAALILLAVPVLVAGAAPALAAEHGGEKKEESGEKKKQKAPEHKSTSSDTWLLMDDFYTTIVGDNRATGMLMVRAGLDIPDHGLYANAERSMPVLRDAYLRSLMAYTATNVRLDNQPDINAIATRLQSITDRALNKKGARVLLQQVALRAK
jgi:flagellar basal body-associated protein FliL